MDALYLSGVRIHELVHLLTYLHSWTLILRTLGLRTTGRYWAKIEKCPRGWVNMHLYNFFVCGPKYTRFLLSNLGGAVVDELLFRFLICPPIPEIFVITVESCQKSRQNLDVFWPSQILGAGLPKIVQTLSPLPSDTSAGKISWGYSH